MNNDTCIVGYIYIYVSIYIYISLFNHEGYISIVGDVPITIKHYESHVIPSGNLT